MFLSVGAMARPSCIITSFPLQFHSRGNTCVRATLRSERALFFFWIVSFLDWRIPPNLAFCICDIIFIALYPLTLSCLDLDSLETCHTVGCWTLWEKQNIFSFSLARANISASLVSPRTHPPPAHNFPLLSSLLSFV